MIAYPRNHLGSPVEPAVAYDIPERAGGACLGVGRAVDDPVDAGENGGTGAHRAGFESDDEGVSGQPPGPDRAGGRAQGEHFGVSSRILLGLAGIATGGDHRADLVDNDRTS